MAPLIFALLVGLTATPLALHAQRQPVAPGIQALQQVSSAQERNAALYRIAALNAQMAAALDMLTYEYRCRPYGNKPAHRSHRQFEAFARTEALLAVRQMWTHARTVSLALLPHYWPLRYKLGRIAVAPDDERRALVCDPDLQRFRYLWSQELRSVARSFDQSADQPWLRARLDRLEQLAALSRARIAMASAYRVTCYNVSRPYDPVTLYPSERIVLDYAIQNVGAALHSARSPAARPPGPLILWQGLDRALQDWRAGIEASDGDGLRRHACGSILWNLALGTYYSWLYDFAGDSDAATLDLVLQWTQLELAIRVACHTDDADILALAIPTVFSALSVRQDGVRAERDVERRRDEIAEVVESWLPSRADLSAGTVTELGCANDALAAVSLLVDDAALSLPLIAGE